MPKGVAVHWSDAHEAILKEWIKKYPKGKTINLKQIEYSEPELWKEVVAAGHTPGAIRDKSRYILGLRVDKPGKLSPNIRSVRLEDGRYQCKLCGEIMVNKQATGAHYRYHCVPKPAAQLAPPTHTTNTWKFCPNCAFPLAH